MPLSLIQNREIWLTGRSATRIPTRPRSRSWRPDASILRRSSPAAMGSTRPKRRCERAARSGQRQGDGRALKVGSRPWRSWSASTSGRAARARSRSPPTASWSPRRRAARAADAAPGLDRAAARPTGGRRAKAVLRGGRGARPARTSPASALTGQMHGAVFLDASRRGHPPGAAVERPAHGRRVRRDHRSASAPSGSSSSPATRRSPASRRPKILWLAQPRARAYARVAQRPAAQGLRALRAHRRARDRRRRRGRHAAARRARARLVGRDPRRARDPAARGCRASTRARRSPARCATTWPTSSGCRAGLPVAAGGGDNAAAAVGIGVVREGAVVDLDRHQRRAVRPPRRVRARPVGPRARVLPRGAGRVPPDGRHARRPAARCQLVARARSACGADFDELIGEAAAVAPGRRGAAVPAVPHRRAHARTSTRTRAAAFVGLTVRHGRGAPDARGDGGRRVLAARRPGDHARARDCPTTTCARSAAARARRSGCAAAGRHLRRPSRRTAGRRGPGLRRGAAGRRRRRRVRRRRGGERARPAARRGHRA